MKRSIKEIIEAAQAELDYQSYKCNCFQTFGVANIEIRGGKIVTMRKQQLQAM